MTISNLSARELGSVAVSVAALLLSSAMSHRAQAYGGLWSSQTAPLQQAAEAVIFVDNPDSTVTAIIQIKYAGPPQKFAWVIPIAGKPTVGVSSNVVFERLDAATAPQYWVEVTAQGSCMQQDVVAAGTDAGSADGHGPSAPDAATASVAVTDRGSLGPYDYVNIAVDPTLGDPVKAATDWLTSGGYELTDLDGEVLRPYLREGLNLLAFKLQADAAVGAIRPVVLTYDSKLPMIPLRPTAVAAQDDMGIKVWVVGPSQAVPINYKSLVINEALIDWLSGRRYVAGTLPSGGAGPVDPYVGKTSNYAAVVTAAANEAGGQGFVTELGAPASQFRDKVWSPMDDQQFATLSSQSYPDGIDAILAARILYRGWDGWKGAVQGASTLPDGVTIDELDGDPERYRGAVEVDATKLFALLDANVIKPVADTAAMLYRAPYLTRLYSTMSADEMTLDPSFDYNADLAQVSNIHIAEQRIECSAALKQDEAPWSIELPQGAVVRGEGSGAWPLALGSIAANLEVVMLETSGSGTVVEDNREEIGSKLRAAAGMSGSGTPMLHPPQHGVMIGGSQSVTVLDQAGPPPPGSTRARLTPSGASKCSASRVAASASFPLAPWLSLAGAILWVCRRRTRGARAS
jgi:hypothetical protein